MQQETMTPRQHRAWITLAIICVTQIYTATWMFGLGQGSHIGIWSELFVLYAGFIGIAVMIVDMLVSFRQAK